MDKKIIEKFDQLKYQYLKKLFEKNLLKLPENCKYNKQIKTPDKRKLNICTFNFDENFSLDLCYKKEHSEGCNAFCPRRTKEQLRDDFLSNIKDPTVRATYFKDLNILVWQYPELVEQLSQETVSIYDKIIVWFKSLAK